MTTRLPLIPDTRLYLAWVLALVATLGSLSFSTVLGFQPCVLCWYQRACMYPLTILLGLAAFRGDPGVRIYAIPLAATGALLALIQNAEAWGWMPTLRACTAAAGTVACDVPWPLWGSGALAPLNNVLTIPVLSLLAFTLILALLSWRRTRE